jgi:mycothiol synthase
LTDDIVVRRMRADELAALEPAVERAKAAGEFAASSDAQAAFFLRSFGFAPSPVSVAVTRDGAVAGFISPDFKVVVVEPGRRRRGIGTMLVEAGVEIERARGRPHLILGVLPGDAGGKAFLGSAGLGYHSTLWDLALPPDAPAPEPAWPDGTEARSYDDKRDRAAFRALFNAAFADHATPLQLDEGFLKAPADPSIEDADTVLLQEPGGSLVGFCATSPERRDGQVGPHAEIWTIGVPPDRQGRGYGRQLLRWGIQRLRSIGVSDVTLSVNSRNEHALGLYEREGFVRAATRERWARAVSHASDVHPGS